MKVRASPRPAGAADRPPPAPTNSRACAHPCLPPPADSQFDLVFSADVLEHLPPADADAVVRELVSAAQRGAVRRGAAQRGTWGGGELQRRPAPALRAARLCADASVVGAEPRPPPRPLEQVRVARRHIVMSISLKSHNVSALASLHVPLVWVQILVRAAA